MSCYAPIPVGYEHIFVPNRQYICGIMAGLWLYVHGCTGYKIWISSYTLFLVSFQFDLIFVKTFEIQIQDQHSSWHLSHSKITGYLHFHYTITVDPFPCSSTSRTALLIMRAVTPNSIPGIIADDD